MASSLKTQPSMDVSEISVDIHTVYILPPDFSKWVDDMEAAASEVDLSREEAAWKKQSIYQFVERNNPIKEFIPQMISFGPFHHGAEHLKENEVHKHRALAHFLNRVGKRLEPFVSRLRTILTQLQDSYGQGLHEKWKENPYEFLKMMLLDGCFMIEVLRLNERSYDYATNDPVFSSRIEPLRKPYIKRDMLTLENQLPLLVLKALLEVEDIGRTDDEYINSLVLSYCGENLKANLLRLASHPLELYRMSLIHEDVIRRGKLHRVNETIFIVTAVDLRESGVHFKCKDKDYTSLRDISFDRNTGTLELPVLQVDDGTKHILLNMIKYEQIHVNTGNEITSYVMFMDALIDTEEDVKLLQKKKIIINSLGSYQDVADLFNSLPKGVAHVLHDDPLHFIRYRLSKNYDKNRTSIWYQYLHNPGKVLSVVALSLVLTLVQTICSVISLIRQK